MESDKRKWEESGEDKQTPLKKRVLGPSLPPPQPSAEESQSGSDTDSEDDFGPSLPPPEGASIDQSQSSNNQTSSALKPEPKQPDTQRDQWMLHPPEKGDWTSKIDPTQLRNRKFQSGKSARKGTPGQPDSSWNETPEERMRRLGDEVMGVGNPSNNSNTQSSKSKTSNAQAMEEKIKKFNDRAGKTSRLEKPQNERTEEEDDPSARAFDREKDMGMSSKISNAKRRDMVNRASDYSSRFTKGEFL